MRRILIISKDSTCAKQIMSAVHHLPTSSTYVMDWYHEDEWDILMKENSFLWKDAIYFVDTHGLEQSFIELLREIRKKDPVGKIILISWYDALETIFDMNLKLFTYLRKDMDFVNRVSDILKQIEKEGTIRFSITNSETPVWLNSNHIDHIYTYPKEQISVQYHTDHSKLLLSFQNPSKELKHLTQGQFYVDQKTIKERKKKRQVYPESKKQLAVDLYLIGKYHPEQIGVYLNIQPRYVLLWSRLSKYQRRHWIFNVIVRKLILRIYFKL